AGGRQIVAPVWVWRRLERVDVLAESIQDLVWPSYVHSSLSIGQHAMAAELHRVAVFHESCIAHQIRCAAVLMRGGVIDVSAISKAYQVGDFRDVVGTARAVRHARHLSIEQPC